MNINQKRDLACLIWHSIHEIQWPANAQEPDYVAKLVTELPSGIMTALATVIPGCQVKAGGAFIHQKPLAHFVSKAGYKDSELGDLLIVCRDRRTSGIIYNAMLFQAKVAKNLLCELIPNDHQFILYSEWPKFEYKRAGVLNGKIRNILPKSVTQGAKYLLIDENTPNEMLTATVDMPLKGSRCFATTIASILSFDDGRTFQFDFPRDTWSQVIIDLLSITASSVFNRRRSGLSAKQRWNGDKAFDYLLSLDGEGDNSKDQSVNGSMEGDSSFDGMGVICIDLGLSEYN